MKARVIVTLKAGVLDPQGKAIEGALSSLGIAGVASVRQGKLFDIELGGGDEAETEALLRRACETLLANTVIENYRIEMEPGAASVPAASPPPPSGENFAPDEPVPVAAASAEQSQPAEPVAASAAAETPATPATPAAVDPAEATAEAARDAEMPVEGHP